MFDLAITGGTLIDGTGAPGRRADVGIRNGQIVAIGELDERSDRTIDADGLVVAPGVVDLHTHYDAQLGWDPTASPSCFHGVTTVIGGNCGFTLAPAGPEHADYLMRMMARVEGMPLTALRQGLSWDWSSYTDWLGRFDGTIAVNAGFLCGHSSLRRAVMGEASGEPASEAQVEAMEGLLAQALDGGALGLSSSQAHTHNDGEGRPVPSRAADASELRALAGVVGRHDGTTLELILAGCINGFTPDETELMTAMSLDADRPLNWNVLGVSALAPERWRAQLAPSDHARARGGRVLALVLPHPMALRLSFDTGFVLDGLPGWREVLHRPRPDKLRALSDPAVRGQLRDGAASPEAGVLGGLARWGVLTIAETFSPANDGLAGRTVAEIAGERGQDDFDTLLDIVVADDLRTGLQPPTMGDTDDDWRERAVAWLDPRTVVGGSDAGAHLDMMCGAVYSTSLLGHGVRERGVISLEEAVRQLTDVPARLYGLRGRGRLAEGWAADVMVFDPRTVAPGPIHTRTDLPGGAPRLYAEASGMHHVVVNGVEIASDNQATGAVPGTVLRSGRDTDTVRAGA